MVLRAVKQLSRVVKGTSTYIRYGIKNRWGMVLRALQKLCKVVLGTYRYLCMLPTKKQRRHGPECITDTQSWAHRYFKSLNRLSLFSELLFSSELAI